VNTIYRAACGLELADGVSLHVKKCHKCNSTHDPEDFEAIETSTPRFVAPRPVKLNQTPVAPKDWPFWAWSLKWMRNPSDHGVGDTAQRIAAKVGGEAYKKLTQRLGMPCGCSSRQEDWNTHYPYEHSG
jgi:hypothetical protein